MDVAVAIDLVGANPSAPRELKRAGVTQPSVPQQRRRVIEEERYRLKVPIVHSAAMCAWPSLQEVDVSARPAWADKGVHVVELRRLVTQQP